MGKCDKKQKFDRINALRKQYDAFLEEEKKRKERNDFILGRLDKIRLCTAVVQIRRKPNVSSVGDQETSSNFPSRLWEYETQLSRTHTEQSWKLPVKFTGDTLLSEITKRYILIPKLRMGADNECIVTNNSDSDNIDWKSKYDILNQLKQDEKEELSESKNIKTKFDNDQKINLVNIDKHLKHTFEGNDDIPEKDKPHDKPKVQLLGNLKSVTNDPHIISEPNIYIENHNEERTYGMKNAHDKNVKNNELTSNECINNPELLADNIKTSENQDNNNRISSEYYAQQSLQNEENISTYNDNYNTIKSTTYEKEYHIQQQPHSERYDSQITHHEKTEPTAYDDVIPDKEENAEDVAKVVYLDESEISPVPILSPNENIQTNDEDGVGEEQPSNYSIANAQELTTMTSVQNGNSYELNENDVQQNIENELESIPATNPDESQEMISQYSTNLGSEVLIDNADLVNQDKLETAFEQNSQPYDGHVEVDNTGIKEFNAEQNEMFYSEQTNDDYNYDQNAPDTSDNYQLNEQYQYYEGGHQDDQINEHDETSQRYDQNYEQQYAEYSQDPQEYTQEPQDYTTEQCDPNQQTYDPEYNTQQDYDTQALLEQQTYETQELVEQNLDSAEGFNTAEIDKQKQAVQED